MPFTVQCTATQSQSYALFHQNQFSLTQESRLIEVLEEFHGVFISQEGGSIEREGSNLEITLRAIMILIDQ